MPVAARQARQRRDRWSLCDIEVRNGEGARTVPALRFVLSTLKRAIGTGADGLSYEAMESCILYEDLSFLVEFYMNADFPEELWPWIASASLFAIDKTGEGKPEGARPIGAGTVYRRLAWRCALAIDANRPPFPFSPCLA